MWKKRGIGKVVAGSREKTPRVALCLAYVGSIYIDSHLSIPPTRKSSRGKASSVVDCVSSEKCAGSLEKFEKKGFRSISFVQSLISPSRLLFSPFSFCRVIARAEISIFTRREINLRDVMFFCMKVEYIVWIIVVGKIWNCLTKWIYFYMHIFENKNIITNTTLFNVFFLNHQVLFTIYRTLFKNFDTV